MAMNGLSKMAATALLLVLAIVPAAIAETYTVGDSSGWVIGVDYTRWVEGNTFRVGDTLEFKYSRGHSVGVVDKAGYDDCDGSDATEIHYHGDTKIELNSVGAKYYISPTPGDCVSGMKLAVTVTPDSPPAAGTLATPTPASGSTSLLLLHQRI